jgi:hypothetical protein
MMLQIPAPSSTNFVIEERPVLKGPEEVEADRKARNRALIILGALFVAAAVPTAFWILRSGR